jgi:hypothetical protein
MCRELSHRCERPDDLELIDHLSSEEDSSGHEMGMRRRENGDAFWSFQRPLLRWKRVPRAQPRDVVAARNNLDMGGGIFYLRLRCGPEQLEFPRERSRSCRRESTGCRGANFDLGSEQDSDTVVEFHERA